MHNSRIILIIIIVNIDITVDNLNNLIAIKRFAFFKQINILNKIDAYNYFDEN